MALLETYIAEKGLYCDPQGCYDYWEKKDWLTKKGVQVKTLEAAINVYNSIYLEKERKEAKKISKLAREKAKEKENKRWMPYKEQFSNEKWKAFRTFIFAVRGKECEMCGEEKNLCIHHIKYKSNKKAWEYTCNDVMVLCKKCHEKVHNITTNIII